MCFAKSSNLVPQWRPSFRRGKAGWPTCESYSYPNVVWPQSAGKGNSKFESVSLIILIVCPSGKWRLGCASLSGVIVGIRTDVNQNNRSRLATQPTAIPPMTGFVIVTWKGCRFCICGASITHLGAYRKILTGLLGGVPVSSVTPASSRQRLGKMAALPPNIGASLLLPSFDRVNRFRPTRVPWGLQIVRDAP